MTLELHCCKHCGEIFEREWNEKRQRPSVCRACNPRSQWARVPPEKQKIYNANYRARRRARRQEQKRLKQGAAA